MNTQELVNTISLDDLFEINRVWANATDAVVALSAKLQEVSNHDGTDISKAVVKSLSTTELLGNNTEFQALGDLIVVLDTSKFGIAIHNATKAAENAAAAGQ